MKTSSSKQLIWDLPIRVFHWLFAASISLALGIALLAGEHSPLFEWHMLFGLSAGFLLLLRLFLFAVGSRHVSALGLVDTLRGAPAFFRNIFNKDGDSTSGHNPLAWGVYLLMFGLLAGTVWTGLNMQSEWAEDVHEVLAWGLLAMIVSHLLGLILHTLRFRENVALSMVTGKKRALKSEAIRSSRPVLGLIVLVMSLTYMGQLFAAYQKGSGVVRLPWINQIVTLGEGEEDEGRDHDEAHEKDEAHEEHHDHD